MLRRLIVIALLVGVACVAAGEDKDPIKEKLFAAKVTYDKDMRQYRKQVEEWLDKREETARKAADKNALNQIKEDRKTFEESGELLVPSDLRTRLTKVRTQLEAAYTTAIKEYLIAKKDSEAAAVEKGLLELRKEFYPLLDLSKVEVKDGYFRIPPNTLVTTRQSYKGGVEIFLVARTESENIRLYAHRGSCVIFNWEINPKELRVCRPDGKEDTPESGSIATAKVMPLRPGTFYTIRWLLTPEGMTISVNGQSIFTEKKEYNLDIETKLGIQTVKSKVDVKEFKVTRILPKQ